jgi:methionyl-tRNA formyltransferase
MELRPPPVKVIGENFGIPVFQTETLKRDEIESLVGNALNADIGVVVASAFFIPKWLRETFPLGTVNLHPSFLPELRGAAPVNWAIIRGYEKTGMTVFRLVKEMDAGPILAQKEVTIGEDETAGGLLERLSVSGADMVLDTVKLLAVGDISPREQDENRVTYAPKISRSDCGIDWGVPARVIYNLYRGLTPRPGAYFACDGEEVKVTGIFPASGESAFGRFGPGEVIEVSDEGLTVACGEGAVILRLVRPPGKGNMSGLAFARGRGIETGYIIR